MGRTTRTFLGLVSILILEALKKEMQTWIRNALIILGSRGMWFTYAVGVTMLHLFLLSIPFLTIPMAWTLTNLIHNTVNWFTFKDAVGLLKIRYNGWSHLSLVQLHIPSCHQRSPLGNSGSRDLTKTHPLGTNRLWSSVYENAKIFNHRPHHFILSCQLLHEIRYESFCPKLCVNDVGSYSKTSPVSLRPPLRNQQVLGKMYNSNANQNEILLWTRRFFFERLAFCRTKGFAIVSNFRCENNHTRYN
jgi:hypothetical protein